MAGGTLVYNFNSFSHETHENHEKIASAPPRLCEKRSYSLVYSRMAGGGLIYVDFLVILLP
jgi:hypothetical protein